MKNTFFQALIWAGIIVAVFLIQSFPKSSLIKESVNESVVFGSRVGKLLVKMNYLEPDKDSQSLSISGQCLKSGDITQAYKLNEVRLSLSLLTRENQTVSITVNKGNNSQQHLIDTKPGKTAYSIDFLLPNLEVNDVLNIHINQLDDTIDWFIGDISLSNENGTKIHLISNKQNAANYLSDKNLITIKPKIQANSFSFYGRKITTPFIQFKIDIEDSFLKLIRPIKLPGLKKNGPCSYVASEHSHFESFSKNEFNNADKIPVINLLVDDNYLTGEEGIYSNIKAKGRASEVPAKIEYISQSGLRVQNVGLRFHGGIHRRKPNALRGYRIYARRAYGNSNIGLANDIFLDSDKKVKTLVLRSNQAYGHLDADYGDFNRGYNPFNHILALEIGNKIGASVPRAQLVDFRINNEKQDLYLALDHLSDSLFEQSRKPGSFHIFNYKKENTPLVEELYFSVKREIRNSRGEAALETLKKYYDINNVINSIILSIYVVDDDYCQGVDIINLDETGNIERIETINWDLDHAFIRFDRDQWRSSFNPEVAGGFRLIDGRTFNRECHRQHTYRHVYRHSKEFRTMLRLRLEELFNNQLSEKELLTLLEKYIEIDNIYFNSKHKDLFTSFHKHFFIRPNIILNRLSNIESQLQYQ